jgi:lysophospholipase L1-like esterase/pimeloyl-ACP methyl ester carboxylesterase
MQRRISILLATILASATAAVSAVEPTGSWFERRSSWNNYDQFHFKVEGRSAYLVAPKQAAPGKPWVWRARFPEYHAEMDVALLGKGFHVAYVDVAGLFGSPKAVAIGDKFYAYLVKKHGLSSKPALEGVSRGGLFAYNWAARNLDKVACIYCDTPVCDFKSWPGGKGTGLGSVAAWRQCLNAYGLSESQAVKFKGNPIDHAGRIARAKIPLLHIVSENDRVVPPKENTYLLKSRLAGHGHTLDVITVSKGTAKSHGHHFDHPAPRRVVHFIARHAGVGQSDRKRLLRRSRRIVFLGDSITYAGSYAVFVEAWLMTQKLEAPKTVINVGLPSETVSGLSEDGHAGGRFPRPDLAERLDRVLAVTRPDLVFACYGINCGIYQPFDPGRFQRFQKGILNLKRKVEAAGATLVLVTPPSYDDKRAKKSFSYNAVLGRYAKWLISQRKNGWLVIDLHGPMTAELKARRKKTPQFTFQPDAVHPNAAGHWFITTQFIRWFGDKKSAESGSPEKMLTARGISADALKLIRQRMSVRRDAYLSAAGHKRPGIRKGLPLAEAGRKARALSKRLQKYLQKKP